MPPPRPLEHLPIATVKPSPQPALEGYTFEGYRNRDGSVGTRNILAITQTVQCVAGVVDFAVQRIRKELLPAFPNVDDVVALDHTYGCGVAIDAPEAMVPIRTLSNISLNPSFGGEVMVISLGCEKLQPERLLPRRARFRSPTGATRARRAPMRTPGRTWCAYRMKSTWASCR
jgi:galactarate dehydratase